MATFGLFIANRWISLSSHRVSGKPWARLDGESENFVPDKASCAKGNESPGSGL